MCRRHRRRREGGTDRHTLMIPKGSADTFFWSECVTCRRPIHSSFCAAILNKPFVKRSGTHIFPHSMAGMKKAMKAAMKATHKECLTISTGSSGLVFGPCSIAQSIPFGSSFFWFGSWWVPGASGRAPEVAETPTDGPGVPPGGPRSPRGPGQKSKNQYLLRGPFKRPSLGAGGRGFVFGPLVWQKTYHCPALQGGRPLSAELVDLATIASLKGHEEGHEEGRRPR